MALLEAQGISKHFSGVVALDQAEFRCDAGEIHALLGENGAGKSTLVKILSGVLPPDSGVVKVHGQPAAFQGPAQAAQAGIVPVFQELSLVPDLTVAQNIFLGREPRNRWGLIDAQAMNQAAAELLRSLDFHTIEPDIPARDLPLAERQLVEIAKAVAKDPQVLILDEGTSALGAHEVRQTFSILRRLREQGRAVVFISHRMEEVQTICDRATIFRDGKHVATFAMGQKSHDEIVSLMIGRTLVDVFPPRPPRPPTERVLLEVRDLGWEDRLNSISFALRAGEILGVSGLEGQGQGDLLLALFGAYAGTHGQLLIDGQPARIGSPRAAMRAGIGLALVPEDRKTQGLILPMSVRENITLPTLGQAARAGFVSSGAEQQRASAMIDMLAIKTPGAEAPVRALSGGNQQKVSIAKWLLSQARIYLLYDPTRGIDVATKQELYRLMRRLADDGLGLLFFSTDLSEIVNLCDRAMVMYEGRVVRTIEGAELTENNLVSAALNLTSKEEAQVFA
jgi:ribose transport system ATP-binding protein